MAEKNPQQELFGRLLVMLRDEFGKDMVFDGFLPPDGTPYPFVYLAGSHQVDDMSNKMQTLGTIYQTVDVWMDDPHKRGTLSACIERCIDVARKLSRTINYSWMLSGCDHQIIQDNTTKTPLLHGIITLEFKLLGGN
ncbi:MAG: hypothetical protein ACOYBC_05545 [Bilifractor sp.]|jgi:hypothetical protein